MAQKKYLVFEMTSSKYFQLVFCALLPMMWMCKNGSGGIVTTQIAQSDSLDIAKCIHGFYEWYSLFVVDSQSRIDFVEDDGMHYRLSRARLDTYLQKLAKCEFVTNQLIWHQREMYLKCEKLWQRENNQDVPSCMDGDPLFCAQEWDMEYWTQSPVMIDYIKNDSAEVRMEGISFHSPMTRKFGLKKEGERWKLALVECVMESVSVSPSNDTMVIDAAWIDLQTTKFPQLSKREIGELSVADFQDSIDVNKAKYYNVDTLYNNEAGKVLILVKVKGEERSAMMVQYSGSNKLVYWVVLFYESRDDKDNRISTEIIGENISITMHRREQDRWKRRTNVYRLSERNIFERI